MHPVRQRLWNPPNAVEDTGINLKNGSPVKRPALIEPDMGLENVLWISHLLNEPRGPMETPPEAWEEPAAPPPSVRFTVQEILREVCCTWGVGPRDVLSQRRTANIVTPRQVTMALCVKLTLRSLPQIGRMLGGRDHTTVLHAKKKFAPCLDAVEADETSSLRAWVLGMKDTVSRIPTKRRVGRTWQ